ncbi:MAG: acetylxylan esterase [Bacteroidales bacterium]|jgi:cephalosporin-C deacetylase-like acetyl esterase
MKRRVLLSAYILGLTSLSVIAQIHEVLLKQSNVSGIYKKGEMIRVYAFPDSLTGDSIHVLALKNNNQVIEKRDYRSGRDSLLIFEGSFSAPCSIITEVTVRGGSSSIGMLVDPQKLKPGAGCPGDFKNFWDNQKKALQKLPLEVKSTPVNGKDNSGSYICTDVEINCIGPKPARGYFARPAGAASKSLPAVLLVHAAGVKGSWCRSEAQSAISYAAKGAICLDLNAHGMLNGQPESYYAGLEAGELKNYWLQGIASRDDYYFLGMYLRLLRAIEFLTRQPEWDGKRILVIGESQGGGQALAAAGLDHRVSAVVAIVPAMCDWMGSLAGRKGGWPQPFESDTAKQKMLKSLPYCDNANILRGSKATIFTEIGMIDMTCPATSVFAAVNQAKGEKIIYAVPYRPHQSVQMSKRKIWEDTIYKPREAFINDYLK